MLLQRPLFQLVPVSMHVFGAFVGQIHVDACHDHLPAVSELGGRSAGNRLLLGLPTTTCAWNSTAQAVLWEHTAQAMKQQLLVRVSRQYSQEANFCSACCGRSPIAAGTLQGLPSPIIFASRQKREGHGMDASGVASKVLQVLSWSQLHTANYRLCALSKYILISTSLFIDEHFAGKLAIAYSAMTN